MLRVLSVVRLREGLLWNILIQIQKSRLKNMPSNVIEHPLPGKRIWRQFILLMPFPSIRCNFGVSVFLALTYSSLFRLGTFCTGGSDGVVSVWDPVNRKRIRQYPKKPASIASLAFNSMGTLMAVAASYCYEEGEKE